MTRPLSPPAQLRIGGRRLPGYRVAGVAGLVLANGAALAVAGLRRLPLAPVALLDVIAVAVFLVLAFGTKVVTGDERLTFYQHALAVGVVSALTLEVLALPVLAYLDLLAVAVLAFQACGRLGCLSAGCCHGRPARSGVVYGPDHAGTGFPAELSGVVLVPVQAREAVGAAVLAVLGVVLAATGAPAGAPLVAALAGYGLVRFLLEGVRGDTRPAWRGLSAAQWTSVLLAASVPAGAWFEGWLGVLPGGVLIAGAAAAVLVPAAVTVLGHRGLRAERRALRSAAHLAEVVRLVRCVSASGPAMVVATTSRGLWVSHSGSAGEERWAMSWRRRPLGRREARVLTAVIAACTRPPGPLAVRAGNLATHLWHNMEGATTKPASAQAADAHAGQI